MAIFSLPERTCPEVWHEGVRKGRAPKPRPLRKKAFKPDLARTPTPLQPPPLRLRAPTLPLKRPRMPQQRATLPLQPPSMPLFSPHRGRRRRNVGPSSGTRAPSRASDGAFLAIAAPVDRQRRPFEAQRCPSDRHRCRFSGHAWPFEGQRWPSHRHAWPSQARRWRSKRHRRAVGAGLSPPVRSPAAPHPRARGRAGRCRSPPAAATGR